MIYAVSNHVWRCSEVFSDHPTSNIRYCNPPTINANCQRFISLTIKLKLMIPYEFHMLSCDLHWFWLPSRRGWFFRQSLKFSWATNAHESKENPNNIQQSYQAKPRKSTLFFQRFPWKESKDRPIQKQIAHHMTSGRIPPNKLAGQDGKTQAGFKIRSFYWDKIGW